MDETTTQYGCGDSEMMRCEVNMRVIWEAALARLGGLCIRGGVPGQKDDSGHKDTQENARQSTLVKAV